MITSGEGRYKVWMEKQFIGKDIVLSVGGGEKPHIGGIVICEPEKEPKVVILGSHMDDIILKPIAKKTCDKYKTTVVAIGGIHIDNATKKEINTIIKNCNALIKSI